MATGYYGIPGKHGGKVHLDIEGRPACGSRIHKDSRFQWCAHGIQISYIECKHCLRIAANLLRKQYQEHIKLLGRRISI
jgi:hypothetical protein